MITGKHLPEIVRSMVEFDVAGKWNDEDEGGVVPSNVIGSLI